MWDATVRAHILANCPIYFFHMQGKTNSRLSFIPLQAAFVSILINFRHISIILYRFEKEKLIDFYQLHPMFYVLE